jgi:hypothetical protein
MKKLITICLVVLAIAANVHAEAISTSIAQIDWTSLTISGDITWLDKGSESYAYAEDDTGSNKDVQTDESGWMDTSASASIALIYGDAYTNDDYLYEEVYAIANDATTTLAYAEAYAARWGNFTANSNGWVEFSADYEIWQQLLTNDVDEWAYGHAEAGLYLMNEDTDDEDSPVLDNEVYDGGSMTDSDKGTLMVSLWFDAGGVGYFEAWASNDTEVVVPVPEPATICILGLGVLSLVRRKK